MSLFKSNSPDRPPWGLKWRSNTGFILSTVAIGLFTRDIGEPNDSDEEEAEELFNFSSSNSGLLFIALDIPYLLPGPIAGWAVDKYGTKMPAVCGFAYLVPVLALLRLPGEKIVGDRNGNVALYSGLLALCGIGMAVIGSPAIVEASAVIEDYHKANPDTFGENGPYAQLYSFNSLVFSAGLTVGPVVSGVLRDSIGYGNMNIFLAGVVGLTAILAFFFVGGRPGRGPNRL